MNTNLCDCKPCALNLFGREVVLTLDLRNDGIDVFFITSLAVLVEILVVVVVEARSAQKRVRVYRATEASTNEL